MLVFARDGRSYLVEAGVLRAAAAALEASSRNIETLRADRAATEALEYLLARQPLSPFVREAKP